MSVFKDAILDEVVLDPFERVNYVNGLVLGVDEFQQEQLYFLERDRLHNRALHGYGTVVGLKVDLDEGAGDSEVRVHPGVALTPRGEVARIACAQCASINTWLLANSEEVDFAVGSPPDDLTLYVVLCYDECKTKRVPIPSGPCLSLDDTSAPSRVADAFRLELRTTPPDQVEEEAVRAFAAFLRSLEATDDPTLALSSEELIEQLHEQLDVGSSPALTPLSPAATLSVLADEIDEICRALFLEWITEIRPRFVPHDENECITEPRESCVLLARLEFPVTKTGEGIWLLDGSVTVDESERPFLLHTRLIQEALCHCACLGEVATAVAPVLTSPGGIEEPPNVSPPEPVITVHADLSGLDQDDHLQYLLTDGDRQLSGDWIVNTLPGGFRITGMLDGTNPTDAVTVQQAVLDGDPAGGDLAGTYPDPQVDGLLSRPLDPTAPSDGQVLVWHPSGGGVPDLGSWIPEDLPAAPSGGGPSLREEEGLVRICGLSWIHRGSTDLLLQLTDLAGVTSDVNGIAVGFGFRESGDGGEVLVEPGSLDDATFQIFVEATVALLPGTGTTATGRALVRIAPTEVIPVRANAGLPGPFIGTSFSQLPGPLAPAALLRIPELAARELRAVDETVVFYVLVRGDFVLDRDGRAIDAEHLRASLPATGDRPLGVEVGVQGGTFESWGTVEQQSAPPNNPVPFSIDVNRGSVELLRTVPRLGANIANRIIEERRDRPFTDEGDLVARVPGIGSGNITEIRRFLRFGNGGGS